MTYDKDSFLAGLSVGMSLRYSKRIPAPVNCLTFSSPNPFTLAVANATKNWDGTLESSTDKRSWTVWDGTTTLNSGVDGDVNKLFVRGFGNTVISGSAYDTNRWVLSGNNISCNGDIRTLLDYENAEESVLDAYCFSSLFYNCTALITAPELPAKTLADGCYFGMFLGCSSLTVAPALPATVLAVGCYQSMFLDCSSLSSAPVLPATTLANSCYQGMFYGCTALVSAPSLPATTLAPECYSSMFANCFALASAPNLPSLTLASGCYSEMFRSCDALVSAPALPATTLARRCYYRMFYDCKNLSSLPLLPATVLFDECYYSMFTHCLSIKLSETQIGDYQTPYRIPSSGVGTTASNALGLMFFNTGGTFGATPDINTTYYTSNFVIS